MANPFAAMHNPGFFAPDLATLPRICNAMVTARANARTKKNYCTYKNDLMILDVFQSSIHVTEGELRSLRNVLRIKLQILIRGSILN